MAAKHEMQGNQREQHKAGFFAEAGAKRQKTQFRPPQLRVRRMQKQRARSKYTAGGEQIKSI